MITCEKAERVPVSEPGRLEFNGQIIVAPWANRSQAEWAQYFRRDDFHYLMDAAVGQFPQGERLTTIIGQLKLTPALREFYGGDEEQLAGIMAKRAERRFRPIRPEKVSPFAERTLSCFQELRLPPFLQAGRAILFEKAKEAEHTRGGSNHASHRPPFRERLRNLLGYSPDVIDKVYSQFHDLTEIYYPLAREIGRLNAHRLKQEHLKEDWEGIAGLKLTEGTMRFYWDPLFINPMATISRYINYLELTISDSESKRFDASKISSNGMLIDQESQEEKMRNSIMPVEDAALTGISQAEVYQLINTFTSHQPTTEALMTVIFDGATVKGAATQQKLNPGRIYDAKKMLKEHLLKLAKPGQIDLPKKVLDRKGVIPDRWTHLFEDAGLYQQLLLSRPHLLRPLHQSILEAFFEVQTGDREITLDRLAERFPKLKRSTLRRNVLKAVDHLEGKGDLTQKRKQRGEKRFEEAERWAFIRGHNPTLWNSLGGQDRLYIEDYYLTDPEQMVTYADVGRKWGINPCIVHRSIARSRVMQINDTSGAKPVFSLRQTRVTIPTLV